MILDILDAVTCLGIGDNGPYGVRLSSTLWSHSVNEVSDLLPIAAEDRLRAVLERAYATFARYEVVSDFVGCRCGTCVSEEENAAIHAKPLHELAPEDLRAVTSSAWIATRDLKHFLPRMLEYVASGEDPGWKAKPHSALATLTHYGNDWTTWAEEEQAVIRDFLERWWRAMLQREPRDPYPMAANRASDALSAIAQVVDDVTPYLVIWEQTTSIAALKQLRYLAESNLQGIAFDGRLEGAHLKSKEDIERTIREWLMSPAREREVRGLQVPPTEPDADAYAAVVEDTAHALAELRRVAADLDYFLDEYWGRQLAFGQITLFLKREASAARVNPKKGRWNRRPREMRRVLDWLSEPGRIEAMRQLAVRQRQRRTEPEGLSEIPMLYRVLDGELPPPVAWPLPRE